MTKFMITLSAALDMASTGRIQIFPDGTFYAKDNRFPKGWTLTKETAQTLINTANNRKDDYMVDYEHQALLSEKNGKPAPAAGWFKSLEYVEGLGLFASVKWTESAREAIKNDEYRYISPTFKTNALGEILSLFNVALTNTPAIDGMHVVSLTELKNTGENEPKNVEALATRADFSSELKALLQLDEALSDDQIIGAVKEMVRQVEYLKEKSPTPDPTQYVPISALTDVQSQLSQLSQLLVSEKARQIDELINQAKSVWKVLNF